jgi:hypothetical protein
MDSLTKFREGQRQYNVMNSHPFRNNKYGTVASEKYLAAPAVCCTMENTLVINRSISRNSLRAVQCNPFKITTFNKSTHK